MLYKVHILTKLTGVSARTLHYYDAIGLLKPAQTSKHGYRLYGQNELAKLQQILFFRELEFSLEKIQQIMRSPQYSVLGALYDQQKLLKLKDKHVHTLLTSIQKTITTMENNNPINQDEALSAFNDPDYLKYKNEVQERWGNTDAYKQSQERMKKLSKDDIAKLKADGIRFVKQLAKVFLSGASAASEEMQKLVDEQYNALRFWYEPNYEMFKGLGDMYVADPRFTKYYDKHAPGLAKFVRDAMHVYSDKHS